MLSDGAETEEAQSVQTSSLVGVRKLEGTKAPACGYSKTVTKNVRLKL